MNLSKSHKNNSIVDSLCDEIPKIIISGDNFSQSDLFISHISSRQHFSYNRGVYFFITT